MNIDATLIAEKPRVAPRLAEMKAVLAGSTGLAAGAIGLKATTNEGSDDIGRGLASRSTVKPQRPSRLRRSNLRRGQSFVLPVVPLHQVRSQLSLIAETGEPARLNGTRQRARQDKRETPVCELSTQMLRLALSVRCQRDVGPAGVASIAAPLGLAVAHQRDAMRRRRATRYGS